MLSFSSSAWSQEQLNLWVLLSYSRTSVVLFTVVKVQTREKDWRFLGALHGIIRSCPSELVISVLYMRQHYHLIFISITLILQHISHIFAHYNVIKFYLAALMKLSMSACHIWRWCYTHIYDQGCCSAVLGGSPLWRVPFRQKPYGWWAAVQQEVNWALCSTATPELGRRL